MTVPMQSASMNRQILPSWRKFDLSQKVQRTSSVSVRCEQLAQHDSLIRQTSACESNGPIMNTRMILAPTWQFYGGQETIEKAGQGYLQQLLCHIDRLLTFLRNSIAVPRAAATRPSLQFPDGPPRFSSSLVQVSKGIGHIFTRFMYWDMAFWVAFWFTLGSAVYVANGVFTWLPVAYPDSYPPADSKMTEGLTAFFGVVFYEIGAVLAYLEAINAGTFHGSAMRRFLEGHQDGQKKLVDEKLQSFFHSMVPAIVRGGKRVSSAATRMEYENKLRETVRRNRRDSAWKGLAYRRHAFDLGVEQGTLKEYSRFRWLPTWKNFREHHVYEVGFLACAIQLLGATIFLVPGLTILPGIYDHMNKHEQIGAYWIPDIVGSTLFIVSSLLFTLETQEKWYRPQFRVVGWWIGFWAVVGSVGFE